MISRLQTRKAMSDLSLDTGFFTNPAIKDILGTTGQFEHGDTLENSSESMLNFLNL